METLVYRAVEAPCKPAALLCGCFHNSLPTLYLANDRSVTATDTVCGSVLSDAPVSSSWGRIQFLVHVPSPNLLCAFCECGVLVSWDAASMVLTAAFAPDAEDSSARKQQPFFACCAASNSQPLSFHCSVSSRYIIVTDLSSKTSYKLRGSRKAIAALASHPKASVLASCSTDGEIRLWDYENQHSLSVVEGALPACPRYNIVFDSSGRSLVATCSTGYACAWHCGSPDDGSYSFLGSGAIAGLGTEGLWAVPFAGSSQRALLITLDDRGNVAAWDLAQSASAAAAQGAVAAAASDGSAATGSGAAAAAASGTSAKAAVLQPSVRVAGASLGALMERAAQHSTPPYATERSGGDAAPSGTPAHGSTLVGHNASVALVALPHCAAEVAGGSRVHILTFRDPAAPPCAALSPLPRPTAAEVTWGGRGAFAFSSADGSDRVFFLGAAALSVLCCGAAGPPVHLFRPLGRYADAIASTSPGFVRAARLVRSRARALLAVVFETSNALLARALPPLHHFAVLSTRADDPAAMRAPATGRDVAFIGPAGEQMAVLADDGASVSLCQSAGIFADVISWRTFAFQPGLSFDRIFSCPTIVDNSPAVVLTRQVSAAKMQVSLAWLATGFQPSAQYCFAIQDGETVVQVEWQEPLGAVLTSAGRVVVVTGTLGVVTVLVLTQPVLAVVWAGRALLASTERHIWSCGVDGSASRVLSVHQRRSIVAGVLPDRLLLVRCGNGASGRFGSFAFSRPFALAEPLALAEIAFAQCAAVAPSPLPPRPRARDELAGALYQLFARYEWQRASAKLVERLVGAAVGDLASCVAQRFDAALPRALVADSCVASLQFENALALLQEEIKASPDFARPSGAASSAREHPLRARLMVLAQACYAFGAYDVARKCVEVSGDALALMHHQAIIGSSVKGITSLQAAVAAVAPMAMACQTMLGNGVLTEPVRAADRLPYACALFAEKPTPTPQTRVFATVNGVQMPPVWVENTKQLFADLRCAEELAESTQTATESAQTPPAAAAPLTLQAPAKKEETTPAALPAVADNAAMDSAIRSLLDYEIPSVLEMCAAGDGPPL